MKLLYRIVFSVPLLVVAVAACLAMVSETPDTSTRLFWSLMTAINILSLIEAVGKRNSS